jgi:hypothetical protein
MAILHITEGIGVGGTATMAVPPLYEQIVRITGESIASDRFHPEATLIRVQPNATCSIKWGQDPKAMVSNMPLRAGQTEYFTVASGSRLRVAVISNS